MFKFSQLSDDINHLIYQHLCIKKIQKNIRKFLLSHTKNEFWTELKYTLMVMLHYRDFDDLQKNMSIRREWKREAQSWLHMLKHHPSVLSCIVWEVKNGYWNVI